MRPDLFSAALIIARKDLAIEFRTRSAFFSAVVFSLLSVAIFYFAWDPTAIPAADLAPGVLWVTFAFGGLLGLHRSFAVEDAEGAMDALLSAPIPREAIFLGKAGANLVFVLGVQAVAIPAVMLFYNVGGGMAWLPIAGITVLASIGLVAVGTLFSSLVANTRLAELLLPLLALPFFVPIVTSAAQATAHLLGGRPMTEVASWLKLLAASDLVFVAACAWIYPHSLDS